MRESGKLYVVATPIGNLEDITFRAIRVLKEVALVAAEDTRRTRKLFDAYSISTPLISLYEHNEFRKSRVLIDRLRKVPMWLMFRMRERPAFPIPDFC
jgi:16S rRNA (cytidine1402-2'-O)-methyltransferase